MTIVPAASSDLPPTELAPSELAFSELAPDDPTAALRVALTALANAGLTSALLEQSDPASLMRLAADFAVFAHPHQQPAETGNDGTPWTTWLVLGGRGAGKTRLGAEWIRALVHGIPPWAARPHGTLALVGETGHEARAVMIEGSSGLLAISPSRQRPVWIATRRRLEWPNGAVAQVFSADDPDSLRGPQFEAAWCDEVAKWRYAETAFDMLQFGLRLGPRPRQMITTTPRPIPLIRTLIADAKTRVTRAGTQANLAHLSPAFFDAVVARYAGTRLGRQELDGDVIDDRPDALWSRALLETCRVSSPPPLGRVVIGLDPPGSAGRNADACGIVAAGRSEEGCIFVLEDASAAGLTPAAWAARAVALLRRLDADAIVAEVNMGGEMVRTVLHEVDPAVAVKPVHATRGKWLRAEPVAALYEQGRVKHVGAFPQLEDEMCDFGLDGLSSGRSPDRLDALVWAVTALISARRGAPRVRGL